MTFGTPRMQAKPGLSPFTGGTQSQLHAVKEPHQPLRVVFRIVACQLPSLPLYMTTHRLQHPAPSAW